MFVGIGNLANEMSVPFKLFQTKEDVLAFITKISATNLVKNKYIWDKESHKYIDTGNSSLVISNKLITVTFSKEIDNEYFFDEGAYFQGDGFHSLTFKEINFNQNFLKYWSDD